MNSIVMCLLSSICLAAADDIEVHVTVKTNRSGSVTTKEFFTRGGETNLLRSTTATNGVVRSRLYRFYHDHKHAADHLSGPGGFLLVQTYNGFNFGFTSTNSLVENASITDKDENVLDMFEGTNGVLSPIPTSELRKYLSNPAGTNSHEEMQLEAPGRQPDGPAN
jgi:hypothetical protein